MDKKSEDEEDYADALKASKEKGFITLEELEKKCGLSANKI